MLDAVELMPDGDPVEKASVMFDKMDDDGSGGDGNMVVNIIMAMAIATTARH